ncbi:3-oxoacyl-ACP reductase FabG [Zooshikella ganghwensis]|uniref:3-oxoacyl-[acyl-carrier-protein] reductase n=1 Tax=Zooshikella ganghwensis TaxID=202772 RepID=A0A4P9VQJ4_9GAMM|nr:3-oxoacyl-ACP reductase FabG [Zooshikella ganghwensis]RDH44330.1 3-oxoacyl-ACP reductase FabG [Zooshikella ganghwensis]
MQGKVALVTGATRGIGKAIAEQLGLAGATVIGTGTSSDSADRISAALAEKNIVGRGYAMDVTDAEQVDAVIKQITEEFGAPLIVVNNAGITRDNLMLRLKLEDWQQVLDTNLTSAFRISKACLKAMTKVRWGRIINVSSVVGSMGNAGQSNYAASKAGIEGFTRALAREIGARGITVNAVAPGFIDTDMTRELPEAHRAKLLEQIPLNRLGNPAEIASVVAFLAGDAAAYVTGETVHVNGGMYMG